MQDQGPSDALRLGGIASVPKYDDQGLVACVCQDAISGEVLMVAWANAEALERTLTTRKATFWSRSRGELWEKGATSGNTLHVESAKLDCDGDAVLLGVRPVGPACHTGAKTCFGDQPTPLLPALARLIESRRDADPESSYVARLLAGDRAYVERKVGEEAVESIVEVPGSERLLEEVADLWFHTLVLLAKDGLDPLAPLQVLASRRGGGSE